MGDEHPEARRITAAIRRMLGSIYVGSKAMIKRFGLTGPQVTVLRTLRAEGPQSAAALAESLFVTASNLTGITDRLEAKGLVKRMRKQGDRRVTLLALTDEGERQAALLPDPIEEQVAVALETLEPAEIEGLIRGLEHLVSSMQQVPLANRGSARSQTPEV